MADPLARTSAPAAARPGSGLAERARAGATGHAAYVAGLNPEQRQAVEALDGPVLVLAGAGTGKTRVLTTRIAHIIATGRARAHEILAVTFTNKAAREMKERVGLLIGPAGEGMPWLGTFHSIGTRILRRHAELVGLKSGFTILDTDDQIRLMKQVITAENIDEKRWPARSLAGLIDGWKNRGLEPSRVPAAEAESFAGGKGSRLYALYQERLKVLNAVDFGDLLLEGLRLLRDNPDILRQYQDRFRFMLVDEYQDTNTVQYLWLKLLAQGRHNVCCVGDDDQSIYGWRGAEVDNILRFEHDFPGARIIRLERNYRSTGHILAAAAHLIAHNQGRLGKTLFTDDELGEKPTVTGVWDSEEEARVIGEEVEQLQRKGHELDEIAILVRASFQMREFEERFITLGVPYRVIGGPRFYERMEIRDALAYLRCVAQPADDLAFERIVNVPKRGLGDSTLQLLHDYGRRQNVPLMQAARVLTETEELKAKPRKALRDLLADFARWTGRLEELRHTELAEMVLEESGYTDIWKNDRTADAAGRLENLKELIRSMEEYPDLGSFLEHVALVMDADGANDGGARVSVMTLHAAKGLEFETVFLPGWEEGLFPHQRSLDENGRAGLEEERRLAYVGLTRTRRRAKIYFATNRRIRGLWQTTMPSRFLDELPAAHVDVVDPPGGRSFGAYAQSRFDRMDTFASPYATPGWQRAQQRKAQEPGRGPAVGGRRSWGTSAAGPLLIEGELVAKSTGSSSFGKGARVFHLKFGNGTVAAVDGNKLTVDFDKAGRKMVVDSFVRGV